MENPYKDCPVEKAFMALCEKREIKYTRPEKEKHNSSNLDFYLPYYGLYVEVKAFSCDRIHDQIKDHGSVMVLVGESAVQAFGELISQLNDER